MKLCLSLTPLQHRISLSIIAEVPIISCFLVLPAALPVPKCYFHVVSKRTGTALDWLTYLSSDLKGWMSNARWRMVRAHLHHWCHCPERVLHIATWRLLPPPRTRMTFISLGIGQWVERSCVLSNLEISGKVRHSQKCQYSEGAGWLLEGTYSDIKIVTTFFFLTRLGITSK